MAHFHVFKCWIFKEDLTHHLRGKTVLLQLLCASLESEVRPSYPWNLKDSLGFTWLKKQKKNQKTHIYMFMYGMRRLLKWHVNIYI